MIHSNNNYYQIDERVEFINKFYLYKGLASYTREQGIECNVSKFAIDHDDKNLMRHFNCNAKWPICLFDFSYANRCPTYFCFRVGTDFNLLIKADYFTGIT